jgi:alpha-2-macroglobulin
VDARSCVAKAGQEEAAKKIIANVPTLVKPYQEMAYSYGSDERDQAIILETLILLGDKTKGFELLKNISASLSDNNSWMSTQSVAWCLKSAALFVSTEKRGELKFSYSYNGKDVTASTELPIAQVELPVEGAKAAVLKVQSESKGTLFVRLITEGTPTRGEEKEEASNLNISVSYADTDGNPIDVTSLQQGTEFIASVTITNPGTKGSYKNLALNQIFPSGWEINNLRLDDSQERLGGDVPTYQDIRDDRVYTYFDLPANGRKNFQVLLTASYAGSYYLPAASCEAMYDRTVYARTKGQTVDVTKQVSE